MPESDCERRDLFHVQPSEEELASELVRQLDDRRWTRFHAAVAWARATGVSLLRDALGRFLSRGGAATIVVGLDLTGTTREGLQGLLDLRAHGSLDVWVYHDEGGSVFHPKVYLFAGSEEARLMVGSSNMTGGGLSSNVEVSLSAAGVPGVPPVSDAEGMFDAWAAIVGDTSVPETDKVVRKLDDVLLGQLVAAGYVLDEAAVRAKQRAGSHRSGGAAKPLFGKVPAKPRRTRTGSRAAGPSAGPAMAAASSSVLLMRLRHGGTTRSTQVQIPKKVLDTGFFGATATAWAAYSPSGQKRRIGVAKSGGSANTRKLEMPETSGFSDIFARFVKTGTQVTYEVHDAGTATGTAIEQAIRNGFSTSPPRSRQTKGGATPHPTSTWWLFL